MIESKTNKIIYLGNGTNRIFNINFDVVNYSTDLKLFLTKVNSNEITEITNNFSIDEINKTVTYPTVDSGLQPLSSDEQIVILRETDITQELDSKKFFKSSDVEFIADKLTMVAQDLKEITNRSFVGPVTSNENFSETVVDMIADEVSSKIIPNQIENHNADETAHPYLLNETNTLKNETNTLKNDLGGLGEQVSNIESKIPENTSASNALVNQTQLLDTELNLKGDIANKIEEHNISPTAHQDIRTAIETLQFVKWVNALPAQGESKYIYAVPREETDTEGKQIAALYLWDGSAWRGTGAFSLDIDPDTLATKTDLAGYLPLTGGTLTGQLFTGSYISLTTSGRGLIFPGSAQLVGFDNGSLFLQNANNGLIFRKSDNQLVRRRNNVDSILLTEAEKAVANGVASLDENAKVPENQLPDVATYKAILREW